MLTATTTMMIPQHDIPYYNPMQQHFKLDTKASIALFFDYFPLEICNRIAFYLSHKQISECRTVCRSWYKLFTPAQYRHIHLRGRRQFLHFYQSVKMGMAGHYVRQLYVDDVSMTAQELASLPLLCPNLVEFSFNNNQSTESTPSPYSKSDSEPMDIDITTGATFGEWKYLRRLTELNGLTVTNYLLQAPNSVLPKMTHLSVSLVDNNPSLKQEFITALSKAASLTDLSLDSTTLSLSEMELIHTACPHLQTLSITNVKLEPFGDTIEDKRSIISSDSPIQQASTMRAFKYQNGGELYMNYEWLYYIARKYPYLKDLELWCEYSVDILPEYDEEDSVRQRELAERYEALGHILLSCGKSLKSLHVMNVPMNQWIFEAMDHAGTQLEHLAIGDMTDHTLHLLQHLAYSQQNISSLTLWGWPSLCLRDTMEETISLIGRCSNRLEKLEFSMRFSGIKNFPLPVDLLLDVCPRLSYLKCDGAQATTSTGVSALDFAREALVNDPVEFLRPSLKTLVLENGSFRNEFFTYISLRCPRLDVLEILSCTLIDMVSSDIKVKIDMPHHCFQRMSIDFVRPPSNYHHNSTPQDIRLFDVTVMESDSSDHSNSPVRRLYELVDYEKYSPNLEFNYEQRTYECTRPINYNDYTKRGYLPPGFIVVVNCQKLNELHLGKIWVS